MKHAKFDLVAMARAVSVIPEFEHAMDVAWVQVESVPPKCRNRVSSVCWCASRERADGSPRDESIDKHIFRLYPVLGGMKAMGLQNVWAGTCPRCKTIYWSIEDDEAVA